jgi:hypothetical protein
VTVGVIVAVTVAVAVGVGVGVGGVGVGVHGGPCPAHQVMWSVSTRQPSLPPLMSLAMRQRSLRLKLTSSGRSTTVVMNPSELPLQA